MILNHELYKSLKDAFGEVRVSNIGERRVTRLVSDVTSKTGVRELVSESGQQFRVCCPKCGDKRFRLYISYLWNTLDDRNRPRQRGLLWCHNERCDLMYFEEELKKYNPDYKKSFFPDRPFNAKLKTVDVLKAVEWPGECIDLKDLTPEHQALTYIKGRNFNPIDLATEWGVRFCKNHSNPLIKGRLIVPIYWDNKMVGWQARAINEASNVKYYTMPGLNKSSILFNGDRARKYKLAVVVEGVFDAFRVGEQAIALLGKSTSQIQRRYMVSTWGNGALCLLLDSDAVEDMQRTTKLFNKTAFRNGIFTVTLPPGEDPAAMDKESIWQLISSSARSQSIVLTGIT